MMDHPTSLSCRLAWGSKPADGLEGSIHLNPFFQLIGELVGQAERIAFLRFEESFPPLLNMDHIHRSIEVLKVLHQGAMRVASHAHRNTWTCISGTEILMRSMSERKPSREFSKEKAGQCSKR